MGLAHSHFEKKNVEFALESSIESTASVLVFGHLCRPALEQMMTKRI